MTETNEERELFPIPKEEDIPGLTADQQKQLEAGKALLELQQSTIVLIWHDAYCEWQILTDNLRQLPEGCRFEGWGETIPEAIANRKRRNNAD